MVINIEEVITRLQKKRKVFVSEADFQLELAWIIKEMYPDYEIRLEYVPSFCRNMHIDILVVTDSGWVPIELKYKTKGCTIIDGGEIFVLKNQAAKNANCYMYLEDIERIEQIRKSAPSFAEGYAIMITNEPSYLKEPAKSDCKYNEFSIHNGAVKEKTMSWSGDTSEGTKKKNRNFITLEDSYKMNWKPYSVVNDTNSGTFYYLVNKTEKR